jgi:hypothetical protein
MPVMIKGKTISVKSVTKALLLFVVIILIFIFYSNSSHSSPLTGIIDSTSKYAYSENIGWISFGETLGNVQVTDTELTGYAYGENIGWISLNCSNDDSCATSNYKVTNDGNGNLSGYAYSENTGWIDFKPANAGVTINSQGEFTGYAYGENIGWISFNCTNTASCSTVDYKVKTDWKGASARNATNGAATFIPPAKPLVSSTNLNNLPSNITQIAVSTSTDFTNVSWEDIKNMDSILQRYGNIDKLYLKFRTKTGGTSDMITYDNKSNNNITLNEGDIVKTINTPDVYIIKYKNSKQYKRLILSPSVFKSYGHLKWSNIKTVSQTQLDAYPTSNLVKVAGDSNIYALTPQGDTGQRQVLDNSKAYDKDSIYEINTIDRDSYKAVK